MNTQAQIDEKIAGLILLAELAFPNEAERNAYLRGVGDGFRELSSILEKSGCGA
jgi:hypothetical protein